MDSKPASKENERLNYFMPIEEDKITKLYVKMPNVLKSNTPKFFFNTPIFFKITALFYQT